MSGRRFVPSALSEFRMQGCLDLRWAGASRIAAAVLASLVGTASVLADPASSPESAWWPLSAGPEEALTNPLERRGREVFDQRCRACHGALPDEIFGPLFVSPMPGTRALRDRYRGELPAELERRTDLSAAYIEAVVRDGYLSMPFFRPTELSDDDLEALIAYLTRNNP